MCQPVSTQLLNLILTVTPISRIILEEAHQPEIKSLLTAVFDSSRGSSAEMSTHVFVLDYLQFSGVWKFVPVS